MKYLVIGLGNLGRAIAESLTRIGNEVIGVDINPHKTEAVKHTISGAISLDTTDKDALNTLPLNEMDAIFVTFGKDFGTSIQTVALLKNLDVNKLIVRGISPIHEAVIRSIGVAEIITPEDDFAGMYASQSLLGELQTMVQSDGHTPSLQDKSTCHLCRTDPADHRPGREFRSAPCRHRTPQDRTQPDRVKTNPILRHRQNHRRPESRRR